MLQSQFGVGVGGGCGELDGNRGSSIIKEKLRGFCVVLFFISDQNMEFVIIWYYGILRSWYQEICFGYIQCEMFVKDLSRGGLWVLVFCEDQVGDRDLGVFSDIGCDFLGV